MRSKVKFHGAYKSKAKARQKEKSAACAGQCFILKRMIRGAKRFVVIAKKV
jgi:hypothetical protein